MAFSFFAMVRIACCGLLLGCLPATELELPEPPFEAKTWVLIDAPSGRVFEPGDLRFIATPNEELAIAAYALTADELQLPIDEPFPLQGSRSLVIDPDLAAVFEAEEVDDRRRTFSQVEELDVFLPDLEPEFCFTSNRCRPAASSEFAWCESSCGPNPLNVRIPPMGVPEEPPIPDCESGEQPFLAGCNRVGSACPNPGEWPPADHYADSSVALHDALTIAAPFDTIAVRGTLSDEFVVARPVKIVGTCVDGATIERLTIQSNEVEIENLRVELLDVDGGGCTVIGSDVAVASNAGVIDIASSVLRTSRLASTTATIGGSVLAGPMNVSRGTMHIADTYVASPVLFADQTNVVIERIVVDSAVRLSSLLSTLIARDSVLGVVTSSRSDTIVGRSRFRANDDSRPFYASEGMARIVDSVIVSKGHGITFEGDLSGRLERVEILAVDTGLLVGRAVRDSPIVDAVDVKIEASVGVQVAKELVLERCEVVAGDTGLRVLDDAVLTIRDGRVDAGTVGIAAGASSRVVASDFVLTGAGIGVEFLAPYERNSSFSRGSIETDIGVKHEEVIPFDVDALFFQTSFANEQRISKP